MFALEKQTKIKLKKFDTLSAKDRDTSENVGLQVVFGGAALSADLLALLDGSLRGWLYEKKAAAVASSGKKGEIQKLLRGFGCSKFGSMADDEAQEILVQFEYRGRPVTVKASIRGYAAAYLRQHPYSHRSRTSKVEHERKAMNIASVAVYSILRDWIKGQITAVETGILTFEGAFLGQIMLPNGRTVLEHATEQQLLPALEGPKA